MPRLYDMELDTFYNLDGRSHFTVGRTGDDGSELNDINIPPLGSPAYRNIQVARERAGEVSVLRHFDIDRVGDGWLVCGVSGPVSLRVVGWLGPSITFRIFDEDILYVGKLGYRLKFQEGQAALVPAEGRPVFSYPEQEPRPECVPA